MGEEVCVVTMYRNGDHDSHSYVYGVFSNPYAARTQAEREKKYRGGKYEYQITIFSLDDPTTKECFVYDGI